MTPRRLEQLLWSLTAIVPIGGSVVMHRLLTPAVTNSRIERAQPPNDNVHGAARPDALLGKLLAADPFRRDHGRFEPATSITAPVLQATRPAPPKPKLVLRGIVGGPPWDAIIEGLPNREGSFVLRSGDSVSGLKVRSVRADRVTIRGMDTTWILKLDRVP